MSSKETILAKIKYQKVITYINSILEDLEITEFDFIERSLFPGEKWRKIKSCPWLFTFKKFKIFTHLSPSHIALNLISKEDLRNFKKEYYRLSWNPEVELIFRDAISILKWYKLWD